MMFTLWYNDMLDVISKQKMVKLVAADFTAKIREQSLGVAAANTREEDAKVPLARRAKAAEPGPTWHSRCSRARCSLSLPYHTLAKSA